MPATASRGQWQPCWSTIVSNSYFSLVSFDNPAAGKNHWQTRVLVNQKKRYRVHFFVASFLNWKFDAQPTPDKMPSSCNPLCSSLCRNVCKPRNLDILHIFVQRGLLNLFRKAIINNTVTGRFRTPLQISKLHTCFQSSWTCYIGPMSTGTFSGLVVVGGEFSGWSAG